MTTIHTARIYLWFFLQFLLINLKKIFDQLKLLGNEKTPSLAVQDNSI